MKKLLIIIIGVLAVVACQPEIPMVTSGLDNT